MLMGISPIYKQNSFDGKGVGGVESIDQVDQVLRNIGGLFCQSNGQLLRGGSDLGKNR